MDKMFLTITANFTLKNVPKGRPGLRSTRVAFGRDGKVGLAAMCASVLSNIFEWYLALDDTETLKSELVMLKKWVNELDVQDVGPDDESETGEV